MSPHAFRDSEVEVLGLDLGPLGRSLFLSHHLSPAAASRPYQEVVGRVTSQLHLRGELQDALTATIRRDSFRTEIDNNQAYQASMAMKLHEIKKLQTRRQSNVLLFRALDRLDEAGWQADRLTKIAESVSFSLGSPGTPWTPTG